MVWSFWEKFDEEFLHNLENGDVKAVFSMEKETVHNAGECGMRSTKLFY